MRALLAGFILLSIPVGALAQTTGFVESIGFGIDNRYRPTCWTPMLVNLNSQGADAAAFQLQVVQKDLDQDRVTFTRDITLNPKTQEKFWVYFLPQPGGFPGQTADELQKAVEVWLCTAPGPGGETKQLQRLPIRFTATNLDESNQKGKKLILWVNDGSSKPNWEDYRQAIGMTEEIEPVSLRPSDLPENVLGYQAVDAVVWLSGDARDLTEAGVKRLPALEEYLREGGRLVVCQPTELRKIDDLADLLPVESRDSAGQWKIQLQDRADLEPLATLATPESVLRGRQDAFGNDLLRMYRDRWRQLATRGPFKLAKATPRPGAIWEVPVKWDDGSIWPYLVRGTHGLGSVTWVAQDLGNPTFVAANGWAYVWDRVFGWKNDPRSPADKNRKDEEEFAFNAFDGAPDLGAALLPGMEFPNRGAFFIGLSIVFFVIYWVVAGPGAYLFLAGRRRKELNWFVFGAAAMAATVVTVLVVRLVLRGSPEIHHLSIVRLAAGQPACVYSRVGLYIPRDGEQTIELKDNTPEAISYATAFPPPAAKDTEFPAAQDYRVAVHDRPLEHPVDIRVPFRSTLKKFQVRWVGDLSIGINGSASLGEQVDKFIEGKLTNQTGADLKNVYLAFNRTSGGNSNDWVLYIQSWPSGKTLDLAREWTNSFALDNAKGAHLPGDGNGNVKGLIKGGWDIYWYHRIQKGDAQVPYAFPFMGFYDRIMPARHDPSSDLSAISLLRHGGRELDLSPVVGAGALAIEAQTVNEGPLPFPIAVDGRVVPGQGSTLFETSMPLDRSAIGNGPTTEPAVGQAAGSKGNGA